MCERHRVLAGGLDQSPQALPQPPLLLLSSLGLRSPFKAGGSQSGTQKDTALMRALFRHTQASTPCPDPAVRVLVATQHRSRASEPPLLCLGLSVCICKMEPNGLGPASQGPSWTLDHRIGRNTGFSELHSPSWPSFREAAQARGGGR